MTHDVNSTKQGSIAIIVAFALAMSTHPATAGFCACGCGSSPLILDLAKNGFILTVGITNGVAFDMDADGFAEDIGWTFGSDENGFLFLDVNGNGRVDDGSELFGNATILPDGTTANDGFEALEVFDRIEHGGNGDNTITSEDSIWSSLRLWIDWSHDGLTDLGEISTLDDEGVVRINLINVTPIGTSPVDGVGNVHLFKGLFFKEKSIYFGNRPLLNILLRISFFSPTRAGNFLVMISRQDSRPGQR